MMRTFLNRDVRGARNRAALAVVNLRRHRVRANREPVRAPTRIRAGAINRPAGRRVGVSQRQAGRAGCGHVNRRCIVRTLHNSCGRCRAGRRWRSGRRWRRRCREAPTEHNAGAETHAILSVIWIEPHTLNVAAQIIDLRETPRDVLIKDYVHTATRRQCERVVAVGAGYLAARAKRAEQNLREGNEVIPAQVQSWAGHERLEAALNLASWNAPAERIKTGFRGQAEKLVEVVRE